MSPVGEWVKDKRTWVGAGDFSPTNCGKLQVAAQLKAWPLGEPPLDALHLLLIPAQSGLKVYCLW